jgi:hypothetical protein
MNTTRSLGIACVFVAGCAVGGASARFAVPPASAQQAQTLTQWEYQCIQFPNGPKEMTAKANAFGDDRWEMSGLWPDPNFPRACFKRPKM